MDTQQPDELEQMRLLASAGGNAFYAKVVTRFRQAGWTVLVSPYHVDSAIGQTHEIDLICESAIPYRLASGGTGVLRLQLFVECRYITAPVVFWFDKRDRARSLNWLDQNTPFRKSAPKSLSKHHYLARGPYVAKLFKSKETQDPIRTALVQSVGALIQRRRAQPLQSLDSRLGSIQTQHTVAYPVVVCSDDSRFYRTDLDGADAVVPAPDLFQLEVDYAYAADEKARDEYFLIDMVRFQAFDIFLKALDIEIEEATLLLANQEARSRARSAAKIVSADKTSKRAR